MKKLLFAVLIIGCLLVPNQVASAHVLVTDETKSKGAVLHIIPDDDPVAGEEATIYFDAQDSVINANSTVRLSISDNADTVQDIPTKTNGTLVTATYTFPVQGVYNLTFTITSEDQAYTFKQSQRIEKGVNGSPLRAPLYAWAEILTIASSVGFALLVIVAINRRKAIAKHSTF